MKSMILAALVSLATLTGCNFTITGSNEGTIVNAGPEQTRTVDAAPFDVLTISIPGEVVYETGAPKVVIIANEKYMEHIVVEQNGNGRLSIKSDDKKIRSFKNTKIYITSDFLSSLTINGAVDMECKHGIRSTGDFSLTLNGAGDLDIAGLEAADVTIKCNGAADLGLTGLRAATLDVTMNGAGDVKVSGEADRADLTINGAGDIDATGLEAAIIRPSVHGVGSVRTR
ncbi:MAG: DUF2807 domain-containing protein [Bacteroidales bacterium]|nr:DUF2807 domain-containing protein [Bacteroidales bacterium]